MDQRSLEDALFHMGRVVFWPTCLAGVVFLPWVERGLAPFLFHIVTVVGLAFVLAVLCYLVGVLAWVAVELVSGAFRAVGWFIAAVRGFVRQPRGRG